ncbi:SoxR reducing system RseC family protein [Bacillota bacterium LX-D]|nr:SoxR reducing system RseC family protein [Bacillota bacterium LX-D]
MKSEKEGVVVAIEGNLAKIRATRHNDCENCGACPGNTAMLLDAQNPVGAKPGQRIAFEIKETNMLKAAFIVYILPLIAMFLGVIAGGWLANKLNHPAIYFQVGGGLLTFALSIIYIKIFDKNVQDNNKMQPVITRILP